MLNKNLNKKSNRNQPLVKNKANLLAINKRQDLNNKNLNKLVKNRIHKVINNRKQKPQMKDSYK